MARQDINRSGEMEVFARVVEEGGFTAAAKALGMTPSAVSKLVARLEARLGSRLVVRSTRKLQLTAEGLTFHERALRVLADLDEAERSVAACAAPRGRLRINSNVPFGLHHLLPLIPRFTALHPEVQVDVTLTDQVIDLLDERAELAIRVGPLKPSQLVAKKLGDSRMALVAAPDYLARRGTPKHPDDLAHHDLITFNFARHRDEWPFLMEGGPGAGERTWLPARGRAMVGDGESAGRLALAGQGITRLSMFHIAEDVAAGRLVPVLEAFNPGDVETISAVYVGHAGPLPARVRAFIDFLAAEVDVDWPMGRAPA
ncbi:LysR family transcriptional regulator [Caulobacter sp. RL271]|jgi:DNA-binding transcriptional LysR family regulator|uniref:LysR family transcriptional regulator n=1 Tax=Caulobacter segnis TaxID=88688 RepID=A0ABY4ZSK3_9CAUL|nr:LysR family transcriptional regulator [Caulobacter segnis]USQ95670.1 LysR family transcriptional regulator [Caulobacter segnis]